MATVTRSVAAYDLLERIATLPIRILSSQATETSDSSSQRLRCKILREDLEDGALVLIFALAVLHFHDARPRGHYHVDYIEPDEWTLEDLVSHLRFWKGALCLDTDYVRGNDEVLHPRLADRHSRDHRRNRVLTLRSR